LAASWVRCWSGLFGSFGAVVFVCLHRFRASAYHGGRVLFERFVILHGPEKSSICDWFLGRLMEVVTGNGGAVVFYMSVMVFGL
jgi:hypothetical protein